MRNFALGLCLCLTSPAIADDRVDGTSLGLGLRVTQNGVQVPLEALDGVYTANLLPAPFEFVFPGHSPELVGVAFGVPGLFALIDELPEAGLFAPGTGYAREAGPDAAHFMTDPRCAGDDLGVGINYLNPDQRDGDGYRVAAIHVDGASRGCLAEGRLPEDTNLMGLVNPIHVVIGTDDGEERLILHFVGS
ncbi:hypothetical protein [Hasllibacter sp. MH4015]|uniref:hypothetical protein n=1 Tax=Hasllibacter sp. MH4015 TaxID=2854029 RepID=UPI001CD27136|nr:hypothetical protein [Hasllibacter sp. MH4015]